MTPETWIAFSVASLALFAIPGPTVLFVSAQAAAHGIAAGLRVVLGIAAANVCQIFVVFLGLGSVIAAHPIAFEIVRWIGAAYLFWIGFKMWRGRAAPAGPRMREGFLVTILNPKSIAVIAALFPHLVDPAGNVAAQFLGLGAAFLLLGCLVALGYVVFAGTLGQRMQNASPACGAVLMGTSVFVAAFRKIA